MAHPITLLGLAATLCFSHAALADKPSWAGGGHGKHGKPDHDEHRAHAEAPASLGFNDGARRAIFDYYGQQAQKGHCPPGLAKKSNGCQPPGKAKQWAKGKPLPAGIGFNDLPRDLLMRLPPAPPQHRYVQVAGDVLMIAVGTSMVVDAVQDILR